MTLVDRVSIAFRELLVPVPRNVTDPVSPMPTGLDLMARPTLLNAPSLLVANVRTSDRILLGPGSPLTLRSTSRLWTLLGSRESRPYVTLFRIGLK